MMQRVSKRLVLLAALGALALSVIVPIAPGGNNPGSCLVAEIREQVPVGEVNFYAYPANHRQGRMPETQLALFVSGNGSYSRKRGKRKPRAVEATKAVTNRDNPPAVADHRTPTPASVDRRASATLTGSCNGTLTIYASGTNASISVGGRHGGGRA